MNFRIPSLFAACVIALSGVAHAQQFASTSKSVHLRAGPGRSYPVVAVLPSATPVTVYSCIAGYTWCDVATGNDRGWVYAGNLNYLYENREVPLPGVAAVIGIGIAAFVLNDYWHDHYVDRWWWPVRRRWFRPAPVPPLRERPPVAPPRGPGVRPPQPHVQPAPHERPSPALRMPRPAQRAPQGDGH